MYEGEKVQKFTGKKNDITIYSWNMNEASLFQPRFLFFIVFVILSDNDALKL